MRIFPIVLGTAVLAMAGAASGQTAISPLIIDRLRSDRAPAQLPAAPAPAKPQTHTLIEASEQAGVIIKGIRFDGDKVPLRVANAAQGFVGRAATRANLEALAAAMSDAYAKTNIALYTVLVPDQNLARGYVRIVVAEGSVGGIRIGDRAGARVKRHVARLMAPATLEHPFSRATLERRISLVRDIPGLTTQVDVVRGSAPATVDITLDPKRARTRLSGGYSSRSATSFSGGQFDASLKLYGLTGADAETELAGAASTDFRQFRYVALAHGVGIGADGLRLSLSAARLETNPRRGAPSGSATLLGATLGYPLIRSYHRNLNLAATIDGLNSDSASLGALIATERTRAARAAASFSDVRERRSASLGVTVSRGLGIFGARVTAPLAETRFTKVNATAGIDQAIGKHAVARLRGSGQYTRDRLPAAERFAVGGADYGRAFDAAVLSADRGTAESLEFALRPLKKGRFTQSELYVFSDAAQVRVNARGLAPAADYTLASAGGGVRAAYRDKASISLELARALDAPFPGLRGDWRLSLGWRYSLR